MPWCGKLILCAALLERKASAVVSRYNGHLYTLGGEEVSHSLRLGVSLECNAGLSLVDCQIWRGSGAR